MVSSRANNGFTVQLAAAASGRCQHVVDDRVGREGAVLHSHVDARHVLIDHAPRPDVQVPDFRIAHIPFGQTHITA